MLLVKVVGGLLRLFGIGFDRCKRTADSGILGLVRFCGKRRGHHRPSTRRRQAQNMTRRRGSDLSSYLPPPGGIHPDGTITPPHFLTSESRKNSTYSHPPSVLKPEYANRPYKEDSDDEGHIMGPWQHFPSSAGHSSSTDAPKTIPPIPMGQVHHQGTISSSTPAPSSTPGFSRVGGGRAHMDSPYAIATELTRTFPSVGPQNQILSSDSDQGTVLPSQLPHAHGHGFERKVDEEVPLSVSNVETGVSFTTQGVLPGAMPPAHIRTKSQTAIIEDYLPSAPSFNVFGQGHVRSSSNVLSGQMGLKYLSQDTFLRPSLTIPDARSKFILGDDNDDDSGQEEADHHKKKKWYHHLRKNRPHSSDGRPSTTSSKAELTQSGSKLQLDQELGGLGGSQPSTRSFVVTRKAPSMGRVGQHGVTSSLTGSPAGYPKASSRPPTR